MASIQHPTFPDQKRAVSDDQLQDWLDQGWVESDEEVEVLSTKTSAEEFIEEQAAQDDQVAEGPFPEPTEGQPRAGVGEDDSEPVPEGPPPDQGDVGPGSGTSEGVGGVSDNG